MNIQHFAATVRRPAALRTGTNSGFKQQLDAGGQWVMTEVVDQYLPRASTA